jgi:hypothetical protein
MRRAVRYPSVSALRADALFVSSLQRSDDPGAGQVRHAIAAAVREFGGQGCAGRVAQEFGDHPHPHTPNPPPPARTHTNTPPEDLSRRPGGEAATYATNSVICDIAQLPPNHLSSVQPHTQRRARHPTSSSCVMRR